MNGKKTQKTGRSVAEKLMYALMFNQGACEHAAVRPLNLLTVLRITIMEWINKRQERPQRSDLTVTHW